MCECSNVKVKIGFHFRCPEQVEVRVRARALVI